MLDLRILIVAAILVVFSAVVSHAQQTDEFDPAVAFRIGERLTYDVSFEKYKNAAYFETHVVSRGKLSDKDAIELRTRIKTLGVFSSAFYMVDETRTTFVSPSNGLPIYTTRRQSTTGIPKETTGNFLSAPTPNYDLVSLIYRLRSVGDAGAFNFQEGERVYNVSIQRVGAETLRTDAGEFEVSNLNVQSEYITELGFRDLTISISSDESRLPVRFRFRSGRSEFNANLASVQTVLPEPIVDPTPTPSPTPRPQPTPKPTPEEPAYIENRALAADLPFELGETLDYRLTLNGIPQGTFALSVKTRSLFKQTDSLLLSADVLTTAGGSQILNMGDFIRAQVDPETLAPKQIEMRFAGALNAFSQVADFEPRSSMISFGGGRVEAPVGTHSILSLLYALRSFNLKPSRDANNPVNDTRVAVFWGTQPYIFTLRPSEPAPLDREGQKVSAQQIAIRTGNEQLDKLNIKVWLSVDRRRLPLRMSIGGHVADLVNAENVAVK